MKFLVRNLYQSRVFKQYLGLSHIIFRQRYLIPQRPLLAFLSPTPLNPQQKEVIGKHGLQKNQPNHLQTQAKPQQQSAAVKAGKHKRKRKAFSGQLHKYHQDYIKPLIRFQKKPKPYQIYAQEQQSKRNQLGKNSEGSKIETTKKKFKKLPPTIQLEYEQKCKQRISQTIHKYGPIAARYRIPDFVVMTPKQIYVQALNKNNVHASERVAFEKLPFAEQQKYQEMAISKKNQSIIALNQFLIKHQLNQAKYQQILQVYSRLSKNIKALCNSKKVQGNFTIQTLQQDTQIWLDFFDLSINQLQSSLNRKKIQKVQGKPSQQLKKVQGKPSYQLNKVQGKPKQQLKKVQGKPKQQLKKMQRLKKVQGKPSYQLQKVQGKPRQQLNKVQGKPKQQLKKVQSKPKQQLKKMQRLKKVQGKPSYQLQKVQGKPRQQLKNEQPKAPLSRDLSRTLEKKDKNNQEIKLTSPKIQKTHKKKKNEEKKQSQQAHSQVSQKKNKFDDQEIFDEDQYLNYDYEQIKLIREINKNLKPFTKNQNNPEKQRK